MANPVVVEAMRGDRIESTHRGAGAVVDVDGRVVMAFGDAEQAVYPRSAVKALQALPLVASGAADRLGLSDKEIALKLVLSIPTVKSHLRSVYQKLRIHNRAQAATYVVKNGLSG